MHTAFAPRRLACALAFALATGTAGAADTAALEARLSALEQQLAILKAELDAQRAQQTAQAGETAALRDAHEALRAAAAGVPADGTAPIPSRPLLPGAAPNTAFSFGGFVRMDSFWTATDGGEIPESSPGRDLYLPGAIPVGAEDEGTDFDANIKFSRLWFGVDHTGENGDAVTARVELDVFGGALGNQVATNTYGITVRHAYVGWNEWLAGQTWSNFEDVAALPEAVDFIGATEGTVFVRQPQLRYTRGPWSFSLENPETTVTPFGGGIKLVSDDNSVPDLTARYQHKADWGHLGAALLVRQLALETTGNGAMDDRAVAAALSLTGKIVFSPENDLRFGITGGQGIGRYTGLGVAADARVDADGDLEALDGVAGFLGWHHVINPRLRLNAYYSGAAFDHDPALTGGAVTDRVHSLSTNVIYSPLPKLDLGAELRLANRRLENGDDGDLQRLHLLVRYSF